MAISSLSPNGKVMLETPNSLNYTNSQGEQALKNPETALTEIVREVNNVNQMGQRTSVSIQDKNDDVYIKVLELKCVAPYIDILDKQLPWYISWVADYVAPNYTALGKTVHIIPCVIAESSTYADFINNCGTFHKRYAGRNNISVERAEYIGFKVSKNDIEFQKIV